MPQDNDNIKFANRQENLGVVIQVENIEDGTAGELITWDSNGEPATIPAGNSGQVLTSNGTGASPTFQTILVDNIDDLLDITPVDSLKIEVLGFYAANDDGGGVYVYNSSSTETHDGGIIIHESAPKPSLDIANYLNHTTGSSGRWVRNIVDGIVNIKCFGAKGDDSTDDTEAIKNSIGTSTQNDYTIYVPTGNYLIQEFTIAWKASAKGEGKTKSIFKFSYTGAGGGFVNVINMNQANVTIENIGIDISMNNTNGWYGGALVPNANNLTLLGVDIGMNEDPAADGTFDFNTYLFNFANTFDYFTVKDSSFHNAQYGIFKTNSDAGTQSYHLWDNCEFYTLQTNQYNSPSANIENIKVVNCTFRDFTRDKMMGFAMGKQATPLSGQANDILISNCVFEGTFNKTSFQPCGLKFENSITNMTITNNVFNVFGSGIWMLFSYDTDGSYAENNIVIANNTFTSKGWDSQGSGIGGTGETHGPSDATLRARFFHAGIYIFEDMSYMTNLLIQNNTFREFYHGIEMNAFFQSNSSAYGPVSIKNNTFRDCYAGVSGSEMFYEVNNNTFESCDIGVKSAKGGLIDYNTFKNVTTKFETDTGYNLTINKIKIIDYIATATTTTLIQNYSLLDAKLYATIQNNDAVHYTLTSSTATLDGTSSNGTKSVSAVSVASNDITITTTGASFDEYLYVLIDGIINIQT